MLSKILSVLKYLVTDSKEELRDRALRGGILVGILNVSDRGLQILKLIVLGRLLSPSAFGILGIALLIQMVLSKVTNLGIQPALVHSKNENIDEYLDTAWFIRFGRGIGIFVVMFLSAPFLASFFGEPKAELVIRVLGIVAILEGITNPAKIYFQKDLKFGKDFVFKISGTFIDVGVAIIAALLLQNVWALVYGTIAGNLVRAVISYLLHPYRPSLGYNKELATEMLSFGRWIWFISLLTLISTTGDDAFVGWFLSASALGLYQMAFRLSNAPATEVTQTISRVSFPTFSKVQSNVNRLRDLFLRTFTITSLVGLPMATGIILVAPSFTRVALGDQWMSMVPAMQIMAVAGLLRAYSKTGGALFKGYGVPNWEFLMNLVRTIIVILTVWPLTASLNITGTAISITLGIAGAIPVFMYKSLDITKASLLQCIRRAVPSIIASVVMIWPVIRLVQPTIIGVTSSIIVGIVVYLPVVFAIYYLLGRSVMAETVGST